VPPIAAKWLRDGVDQSGFFKARPVLNGEIQRPD